MSLTNEQILQEIQGAMIYNTNSKKHVNEALTHAMTAIQNMDKKLAAEYERGCNDAWEVARKIGGSEERGNYDSCDLLHIFNNSSVVHILDSYTYEQANNKVKAYELKKEKEAEKPIRGDEVVCNSGLSNFIGIYWGEGEYYYYILCPNIEKPREMSKDYWKLTKTGKHVDLYDVK